MKCLWYRATHRDADRLALKVFDAIRASHVVPLRFGVGNSRTGEELYVEVPEGCVKHIKGVVSAHVKGLKFRRVADSPNSVYLG